MDAGFAEIMISSPVAGLRPGRASVAGRTRTSSCTTPPILTFSALPISSRMTSSRAPSAFFASARERPAFSATASASCVCVNGIETSWIYWSAHWIQAHREDGGAGEPAKTAAMDDLRRLRDEIGALDRGVLEALNRRLELVRRINEHKQDAGRRVIDAEREAELLRELSAANAGPL